MFATGKTNSTRTPTGVAGFDAITGGGVPAGRVTVVMGGAGSGKTIFALEALVHGARRCKEPGLFVAFEEKSQNVLSDMAQFEWNVGGIPRKSLGFIDAQIPEPVLRGGAFDLLGLLAVIGGRARSIGARRVVLDGIR
jgi:circadian clock protein KaiC